MTRKTLPGTTYASFLKDIIKKISETKITVARVINSELTKLYWTIGEMISEKQKEQGWGKNVIEKLAIDIKKNTGSVTGFSPRNLWFMKQFYEEYHDTEFLKQLVSELKLKQPVSVLKNGFQVLELLPWGHHILLMQKTKKDLKRIYYLLASIECGWSRSVLLNQIKANAFKNHKQLPKQHNLELGQGFNFVERQKRMVIDGEDFKLDYFSITVN